MANHTNWLNISAMSGSSGQTILTLTANTNYEDNDKVATIKAYNPVYNVSATTTVRISAYTPYIETNKTIVGVAASGGTVKLAISSNCSYVISYPDMVSSYSTTAGTGNTNITFSVPGTSADTTVVGNIVITDTTGQYSTTVRIEQYGAGASIYVAPQDIFFDASGGTATIYVTANCAYNVTLADSPSGWCSISPASGYTGQTIFTVSAAPNSDSARTGVAIFDGAATVNIVEIFQAALQIPYTADTSTIAASGGTRVITIDTTGLVDSSITVDIQNAPGATYTYSNGVITVTIPDNSGSTRDVVVTVTGKTTGNDDAAARITFPQAEHTIYQIPYMADTSVVDASGETRTITIDISNLVASSITVGIEGATDVIAYYNNGVVTVILPNNTGITRTVNVNVSGVTNDGDPALSVILYMQEGDQDPAPSERPLTFKIKSTGTIVWKTSYSGFTRGIQYSKDSGSTWTSIQSSTGGTSISVNVGDTVQFRGYGVSYGDGPYYNSFSGSTAKFKIDGNIMSLIDSTGYTTATTLESTYTFYYLFRNCSGLTSAEKLVLPATTLANNCYDSMFYGCTSLTKAPSILPATTLTMGCYISMFYECTSLTTAPALPATTLTERCYSSMFAYCTSLTTAPSLPATTLARSCYSGMFAHCTSLTTASALPATTLAERCYENMFYECTSLTTTQELPATILAAHCYESMFYGCTSLTTAPALPATTLTKYCYGYMFLGCTSLTQAPSLPATTLANNCYSYMFWGCTSLATAPELPATTLVSSCYSHMFYKCTSLNYIKCLAIDISAYNCTSDWVDGVASSGTFVKVTSMTGWTTGNSGIPTNWVVQNYDPDPPIPPTPQEQKPLTFKITSSGAIYWKASRSGFTRSIQYSKDSGSTWTSITSTTGGTSISVSAGDVIQFRGNNARYGNSTNYYNYFSAKKTNFEVEGNIMSLIDSTGFATATTLESTYTFYYLFYNCTGLTSAEKLVLPATTLTDYCYWDMFLGCSSLTTAPELPATTLANNCYEGMFYDCRSLNYIKCLATEISASQCTSYWLSYVASTGTFITPSSTNWSTGESGIPSGWTRVDAT